MTRYNGTSDGLVVRSADLAAVVNAWLLWWYAEYDYVETSKGWQWNTPGHPFQSDLVPMGAYEWLSQESGIPIRSIWRVTKGETQYVSLRIADSILTALGKMGEVEIIPNPRWSQEHWSEWWAERTHCDE